MRTWELFRQALAGAARARLRSTLTALGVAIGCGALVSMIAFASGLQRQIEAPLKRLGMLNDIHVRPHDGDGRRGRRDRDPRAERSAAGESGESPSNDVQPDEGEPAAPPQPPAPLDDAAIAKFRKLPGVKYAYPDVSINDVEARRGDKSQRTFAVALPREAGMMDQLRELLVAGHFFSLDDAPEALVAEQMLDELGFDAPQAALDEPITISSAGLADAAGGGAGQFEFQRKSLEVRIVGVFRPPSMGGFGPLAGGRALVLPIDVVQQLPGLVESQLWRMRRQGTTALNSYAGVTVRAESPAGIPKIVEAIEAQGFETQTVLSRLEDMRVAFLFIESLLSAVGSVALVIAGLGIANTLLMTVLERYEEIGLYKAIGATDGDVRLMFIAEAAVLGLVGSLAGLVLAAVVCWGLQWGVSIYLEREGVKRAVDVFYFPWWLLGAAVAVSTAMSVVSGLYPASRAARVDPIKALRRA
jgi:putative ABC transport system permease protein